VQKASGCWDGIEPELARLLQQYTLGTAVPAAMTAAGVCSVRDLADRQRRLLALDTLTQVSGADRDVAKRFLQQAKEAALDSAALPTPPATATQSTPTRGSPSGTVRIRPTDKPIAIDKAALRYDRDRPLSDVGGQKTVYRGVVDGHANLGDVAIAVFRAAGSPDKAFLAELEVLQQLAHPHVLKLLAYCRDGWVLVSPLLPRDLFTALHVRDHTSAPMTSHARLRIMREVCAAFSRCNLTGWPL
jgi:serine/threonine protein kinase